MDVDPTRSDDDCDRDHGFDLCSRFNPGSVGDYARPVYRLYFKYLCHSRLAISLLPACGANEPFHLSANRPRAGARVCGHENDHGELSALSARHLTGNHCSYSGSHHWALHVEDEARHGRRPKISIAFGAPNHLTASESL